MCLQSFFGNCRQTTPWHLLQLSPAKCLSTQVSVFNCWAFRIGIGDASVYRSDDNGEPAGSAGKPILQAIENRNLSDVATVVTRYFGGTKLGIGGLIRAYSGATYAAIDQAKLSRVEKKSDLCFQTKYSYLGGIQSKLKLFSATIVNVKYTNEVKMHIRILESQRGALKEELKDVTNGTIEYRNDI